MYQKVIEQDIFAFRDMIIGLSSARDFKLEGYDDSPIIGILHKALLQANSHNPVTLMGFVTNSISNFHENLNTLEFCTRFVYTMRGLKDNHEEGKS